MTFGYFNILDDLVRIKVGSYNIDFSSRELEVWGFWQGGVDLFM